MGAEYNYRKNHLNLPNQDLYGFSVYGNVYFLKKFEYFARYDNLITYTKPNETLVGNYNADEQAIITGFHFSPIKNINFSFNYQGFIPKISDINLQHHILLSFEYKL